MIRAVSRDAAPGVHVLLGGRATTARNCTTRRERVVRAGNAADAAPAPCDPRLSRSLLRGLSLLARFGPDRPERGVVELAAELEMSPSTAHRYVLTLVEAGLLEQAPRSRKYRLAGALDPSERA